MAKDREKLFRGVDDKAITFQRAVFIVCNLKRLIKRPTTKKEDKLSGNSRKRSDGEQDEQRSGNAAFGGPSGTGARKSKFRNPIRRAFTLPTMLCNSFVVGTVPAAATGVETTASALLQETEPEGGAIRKQIGPSFYEAWKHEYSLAVAKAAGADVQDLELNSTGSGQPKKLGATINNVSSLASLATPVRLPRNQNLGACHKFQPEGPNLAANLRSATSPPAPPEISDNHDSQGMLKNLSSNRIPRRPLPESNNSERGHFRSVQFETRSQTLGSICGEQVYCPIWALAMARLDASQSQPRDQSRFVHLIGPPPSTKGYSFAPEEPAGNSPSKSEQSLNCPRVFVSSGPSSTAENSYNNQTGSEDELASSINSEAEMETEAEAELELDGGQLKMSLVGSRASSGKRQPRRSSNESMEKGKASGSLSGEHSNETARHLSGLYPDEANQTGNKQQLALESSSTRMKRFSSAQCLSNKEQISQQLLEAELSSCCPSEDKSHSEEPNHEMSIRARAEESKVKITSYSHQRKSKKSYGKQSQQGKHECRRNNDTNLNTSACTSGVGGLLLPDDPMILARQRRPSVSNQGSLNVDQQALFSAVECNQLERVRAILEEGKIKVNSLNGDKLTCLDIAVLLRNVDMVSLLQQYNAKEGSAYLTREGRANQLYALYTEARRLVEDLSRSLNAISPSAPCTSTAAGSTPGGSVQSACGPQSDYGFLSGQMNSSGQLMLATGSLLSSALLEEKQRQLQYWRRRLDLFTQMRYEFERLQIPSAPELIVLQVTGENSLGVKIVHSLRFNSNTSEQQGKEDARQEGTLDDMTGENFAREARSLNSISLADLDSLPVCIQGRKCTHWKLLAGSNLNLNAANSIHQRSIQQPGKSGERRPTGYRDQEHGFVDRSNEEKLTVFNQLLEQQLNILRKQQRSHQLNKLQTESSWVQNAPGPSPGLALKRPSIMMMLSQNTSTDSACENLTASSQISKSISARPEVYAEGSRAQLESCQSITYKLITSQPPPPLPGLVYEQLMSEELSAVDGILPTSGASDNLLKIAANYPATGDDTQKVIITKYKIDWSLNEQMNPILNSMIVYNTNNYPLECQIGRLVNGQSYFVRVSSGNHKGFSESRASSPACLSPSSWRQVDGNKRRKYDEEVYRKFTKLILLNKHVLDDHHQSAIQSLSGSSHLEETVANQQSSAISKSSLINMLLLDATVPIEHRQTYRLADGSLITNKRVQLGTEPEQEQYPKQEATNSVRKNLRNFFQSNSFKFHKLNNQNKRGLYLAAVIYHSKSTTTTRNKIRETDTATSGCGAGPPGECDKIIVTNDDRLPIIEIVNEPISPGALMSDFYWLLKINGTQWMDIKRLRQQLQKCHSSSTLHIRIKLLTAIEQMQLALNLEDIGRLFYKPLQAHDGSMIICTCRQVTNMKAVSNLSIKWTNQSKIIPKHLRKISDTISSNSQGSNQSAQNQNNRRRADSGGRDSTGSATILPATTITIPQQPPSSAPLGSRQQEISSAIQEEGSLLVNYQVSGTSAAGNSKLRHNSEYKLCEFCQQALHVQRRPTMASGSSSSSLTSSNDSQWSLLQVQQQQQQQHTSGGNKCTCNRSTQNVQSNYYLNSYSGGAGQRNSSASSVRSGSMIGTPPAHHASVSSGHSRQSQGQHLSVAQKSSTYLMLASLSLYDLLLFSLNEIIHFDTVSTVPLNRGLYLGFVQLQTTVESMRLLVPRNRPNMVPCARVRDNAHVSKEEWQLMKLFASSQQQLQTGSVTVANSGSSASGSVSASQRSVVEATFLEQARCSDRSIWSLERLTSQAGAKCLAAEVERIQGRSPSSSSSSGGGGFERTRAKSVSPGLTEQQLQTSKTNSAGMYYNEPEGVHCLSISTSQLSSSSSGGSPGRQNLPTRPNLEASQGGQQALSDSALMTVRNLISAECGQLVTREPSDINYDIRGREKRASGQPRVRGDTSGSSEDALGGNLTDFRADAQNKHSPIQKEGQSSVKQLQQASSSGGGGRRAEVKSPTGGSRLTVNSLTNLVQSPEETFVRLVGSAGRRLLAELKSQLPKMYDDHQQEMVSILQSLNDDENNRIYHLELIELSSQLTFILLIPAAENVCPVTSHEKSNILGDNKDYMLLPLQIFETIHISTYEPDLLGKYSRLSAILETDLIVAQHDHRQAFSSNELKSTKSRVSQLQDMVSVADEFWRQLRWIVDVVSFARDKSVSIANNGIRMGSIWRHFELSDLQEPASSYATSNVNTINKAPYPQREPLAPTGNLARSLQVKRTSSPRARDDQSSLAGQTIESVPEIYLSKSNSTAADEDNTPNNLDQNTSGPSEPHDHTGSAASAAAANEDDEAIYAYLMSLKDATRTAAQRKSSQQSTRPMLDFDQASSGRHALQSPPSGSKLMSPCDATTGEHLLTTRLPILSGTPGGGCLVGGRQAPEPSSVPNELITIHDDFCAQVEGNNPDNVVYVPREWTFQRLEAQAEGQLEPKSRTGSKKGSYFKTTNPFLTDSFEQQ